MSLKVGIWMEDKSSVLRKAERRLPEYALAAQ